MVWLERILDYRGVGLGRFHCFCADMHVHIRVDRVCSLGSVLMYCIHVRIYVCRYVHVYVLSFICTEYIVLLCSGNSPVPLTLFC